MSNFVIIGGSSAIGRVLTSTLLDQGHEVFVTYNSSSIDIDNPRLHTFPLDIHSENHDLSWIPEVVDGFVYLPGSIQLTPFSNLKKERVNKDLELHAVGAIPILQHIIPRLKKSEKPGITFVSTVAVQTGFNFHAQVAMAKGAVEGLTRSLAAELAPSIRVNAVAPSITKSPMAEKFLNSEAKIKANEDRHPLKEIGSPEDIAQAINFSLKSKWITGQILTIDGGITSIR